MRQVYCPSGQEAKTQKVEEFRAANNAGEADDSAGLTALWNGDWMHGFKTAFWATILLIRPSHKYHSRNGKRLPVIQWKPEAVSRDSPSRVRCQVRRSLRILRRPTKVSTGPETA